MFIFPGALYARISNFTLLLSEPGVAADRPTSNVASLITLSGVAPASATFTRPLLDSPIAMTPSRDWQQGECRSLFSSHYLLTYSTHGQMLTD